MYKVRTFNNIAEQGLKRFPQALYQVADSVEQPDAIILRSHKLHDHVFEPQLKIVGRAGAGVNNVPVDKLSALGVPVLNAPGANANAVKELVLAGMLMAMRNVPAAINYAASLTGSDAEVSAAVEKGKKQFAGGELPGRVLGIIGLGAIGVEVANAAQALGMRVIGFDPALSVLRAWQLSAAVEQASSLSELLSQAEFVSVHVPLSEKTKNLLGTEEIAKMGSNAILLNFSRGGIVDEDAVCKALNAQKMKSYVTDFPTPQTIAHDKVIALPHLGASTAEAEVNCACMVADNVRGFLEQGNIRCSVNFPEVVMPRGSNYRLTVANANVPNMLGQISTELAKAKLNIVDMINKSRGDLAYTLVDVDGEIGEVTLNSVKSIEGVLSARVINF